MSCFSPCKWFHDHRVNPVYHLKLTAKDDKFVCIVCKYYDFTHKWHCTHGCQRPVYPSMAADDLGPGLLRKNMLKSMLTNIASGCSCAASQSDARF